MTQCRLLDLTASLTTKCGCVMMLWIVVVVMCPPYTFLHMARARTNGLCR